MLDQAGDAGAQGDGEARVDGARDGGGPQPHALPHVRRLRRLRPGPRPAPVPPATATPPARGHQGGVGGRVEGVRGGWCGVGWGSRRRDSPPASRSSARRAPSLNRGARAPWRGRMRAAVFALARPRGYGVLSRGGGGGGGGGGGDG